DEALEVASTLPFEKVSTYPERTYLIQSYSNDKIKSFVDKLDPKRSVIILAAPKSATGVSYNKEEEWTKTPYRLDKVEAAPLPSDFELPLANRFLPRNFDLISPESHFSSYDRVPKPGLIVDEPKGQVYFWSDEFYKVPETYMSFEIRPSAFQYKKGKNQALSDLFVKIFTFKLLETVHEASLAGTDIAFKSTPKGFILNIDGYSDRSYEILAELINQLKTFSISEELFHTQLEELKRDYQNQLLSPPYEQLRAYFLEDIVGTASIKQKMQASKKLNLEDFETFVKSLFEKAYTAGLVIGNIRQEDAKNLAKLVLDLNKRGYPLKEQKKIEFRNLEKGPFMIDHKLKGENSAMVLAIEDAPFNSENRAINQLLGMGLRDAYFKALRTEQQTGYVVKASNEEVYKRLYQIFIIQSSTYPPLELLYRTEAFLDNYARLLEQEITEERFKQMKNALIVSLKEKPQNLEAMGELLFKLGFEFDGNFNWIQERIETLEALEYKTFIEKGAKLIGRKNPKRLAIFLSGSHFGSLQYKLLKAGSRN
ncbi:MAG: insulinase family protein, partial [Parachlamydiaceae bacterium]